MWYKAILKHIDAKIVFLKTSSIFIITYLEVEKNILYIRSPLEEGYKSIEFKTISHGEYT